MPYNPYNFPHKLCRATLFETASAIGTADYGEVAANVKGLVAELRGSPPEPLASGARLYLAFNDLVGQQLLHLGEEESALADIWRPSLSRSC